MEQTIKCMICGNPYVIYSYYSGDQSACPICRAKARERIKPKPSEIVIDFGNKK